MNTHPFGGTTSPQPPRLPDLVRQVARTHFGQDGPGESYANWTRRLEGVPANLAQWRDTQVRRRKGWPIKRLLCPSVAPKCHAVAPHLAQPSLGLCTALAFCHELGRSVTNCSEPKHISAGSLNCRMLARSSLRLPN